MNKLLWTLELASADKTVAGITCNAAKSALLHISAESRLVGQECCTTRQFFTSVSFNMPKPFESLIC